MLGNTDTETLTYIFAEVDNIIDFDADRKTYKASIDDLQLVLGGLFDKKTEKEVAVFLNSLSSDGSSQRQKIWEKFKEASLDPKESAQKHPYGCKTGKALDDILKIPYRGNSITKLLELQFNDINDLSNIIKGLLTAFTELPRNQRTLKNLAELMNTYQQFQQVEYCASFARFMENAVRSTGHNIYELTQRGGLEKRTLQRLEKLAQRLEL